MKKTRILYLLIILIMVGLASLIYAFWFSNLTANDVSESQYVTVGVADPITTVINTATPTDNRRLIPVGTWHSGLPANHVEELQFRFAVNWTEQSGTTLFSGATGVLNIEFDQTSITGLDSSIHHLVAIDYMMQHPIVLGNPTFGVYVHVTLLRPQNLVEFDLLTNQQFTFEMNFSVDMDATIGDRWSRISPHLNTHFGIIADNRRIYIDRDTREIIQIIAPNDVNNIPMPIIRSGMLPHRWAWRDTGVSFNFEVGTIIPIEGLTNVANPLPALGSETWIYVSLRYRVNNPGIQPGLNHNIPFRLICHTLL